jgi:hypothetical protein
MRLAVQFLLGDKLFSEEEALEIYNFLSKHFNPATSWYVEGGLVCPDPRNPKHTIISKPFGED